jgi:N-formylglutamate deformylase
LSDNSPVFWSTSLGAGAVMATAIHDGHLVRPDVASALLLTDEERLREEDPGTGAWTVIAPTRIVVHRSRFEVDLNRPLEGCVYRTPDEAWGLAVWREAPSAELIARSRTEHRAFYGHVRSVCDRLVALHGRFVVLDLHSYNHRRGGSDAPWDDPGANPDINLGTGSMDRELWSPVVEAFLDALRGREIDGRALDVRENVRFRGGWFSQWIHENYPEQGCALAVEVKKFFMDEWTGAPFPEVARQVQDALAATVAPIEAALARVSPTGSIPGVGAG